VISDLDESEGVRGSMAKAMGVLVEGARHRRAGRGDHVRGHALPRLVHAWQA
jgi:hypothetical protein